MACKEYPCERAFAGLGLIGFSRSEASTILIKKYTKATSFTMLIDSILLDSTKYSYSINQDTLRTAFSFPPHFGLVSDYDYRIVLPSIGKEYTITDIAEDFQTRRYGILSPNKVGCVNSFTSYKVDGQLQSVKRNFNTFYIRK